MTYIQQINSIINAYQSQPSVQKDIRTAIALALDHVVVEQTKIARKDSVK